MREKLTLSRLRGTEYLFGVILFFVHVICFSQQIDFDQINLDANHKNALQEFRSVRDFGAVCDGFTDDTNAFQIAINTAKKIRIPAGTCVLESSVRLDNDVAIRGDGIGVSVIKRGISSKGAFAANSDAPEKKITGIEISDLTIYGQSDIYGFSEFQHLVTLNGVQNVLINKVEFRGFRGDGLYIGSGLKAGDERHNENIIVQDSLFDGINHTNRNGISIIDANKILIKNNRFINISNERMPGAVDFEPDNNKFHIVKNVNVENNEFVSIGGNVGAISFVLNSTLEVVPTNLTIKNNKFFNVKTGIVFLGGRKLRSDSENVNLIISNNLMKSTGRPFEIRGVKGFNISKNIFEYANSSSILGYLSDTDSCYSGIIDNNYFTSFAAGGLTVFSVEKLRITKNQFVDIDISLAGYPAIEFNRGTSRFVAITDNIFRSNGNLLGVAIRKETTHVLDSSTYVVEKNEYFNMKDDVFNIGVIK